MNMEMNTPTLAGSDQATELLLRETNHRCANDLQLVVSLLTLQSRRVSNPEAREALMDAADRVSVLARARSAMMKDNGATLETALRQTCEALHAQAEPRSILISMTFEGCPTQLTSAQVTTVALAVNELATNAIKHAFEEGKAGHIRISVEGDHQFMVVTVDDDGLPFDPDGNSDGSGLGLSLVDRLVASVGGKVIKPAEGKKVFQLCMPIDATASGGPRHGSPSVSQTS
jgi:two-component sensor histidine kinase